MNCRAIRHERDQNIDQVMFFSSPIKYSQLCFKFDRENPTLTEMRNTIVSLIIGSILFPVYLNAQNNLPVFAGKVQSISRTENSALLKAGNAVAEIISYSSTVIRIRITRAEPKSDFSYAVVRQPVLFSGTSLITGIQRLFRQIRCRWLFTKIQCGLL